MSELIAAILFMLGLGPNPNLQPEPDQVVLYGGGIPTTPPTPN